MARVAVHFAFLVAMWLLATAQPTVQPAYNVTPKISGVEQNFLSTSCDPLVVSVFAAFVCVADETRGISYVKAVTPSNSAFTAGAAVWTDQGRFTATPSSCGGECAIVFVSGVGALYGSMNVTDAAALTQRSNSTANVVFDPVSQFLFVPIGTNLSGNEDELLVLDARAAPGDMPVEYTLEYSLPYSLGIPTLLGSPIVYNNIAYFLRNNTFFAVSVQQGNPIFQIDDPCGLGPEVGDRLHLAHGTFGQDENGPLDAFVVYGNTSSAKFGDQFTVCRVSHNSGSKKWVSTMASDAVIDDVTFGAGFVIFSGESTRPDATFVWFVNAETGNSSGVIIRENTDWSSFPAFVGSSANCTALVAFQVSGVLAAYCPSTFSGVRSPAWRSLYGCDLRPVVFNNTYIVCVTYYSNMNVLSMGGSGVWTAPISALTTPQLVADPDSGAVYVFVQDANTNLLGYALFTPPPPPPPPTSRPTLPPVPSKQPTFVVTPSIDGFVPSDLTPSCDPLVQTLSLAFVCVTNSTAGFVKAITPNNASLTSGVTLVTPSEVVVQPSKMSQGTALIFTNGADAVYATLNMTDSSDVTTRSRSTADVVFDPVSQLLFIPIGTNDWGFNSSGSEDELLVLDARAAPGDMPVEYTLEYSLPYSLGIPTLLGSPIVYNNIAYFLRNNTFFAVSVQQGNPIFQIDDPCGLGPEVGDRLHLAHGTFGQDENGPLDAFVVYGNTSSAKFGDQFTVCRVSHNSGSKKWVSTMASDAVIDDVTFGAGFVIFSGESTRPDATFVWFVNAETGNSSGVIIRENTDWSSFPAFVGSSANCTALVAFQVSGVLAAYCPSTFSGVRSPAWRSLYGCDLRPVVFNNTYIVCVTYYSNMNVLSMGGSGVWTAPISALTTPQLVADPDSGAVYVFVQDANTSLLGFELIAGVPASSTPASSSSTALPSTTTGLVTTLPPSQAPATTTPVPSAAPLSTPQATTAAPAGTGAPLTTTSAPANAPPDDGGDGGALSGGGAAGLVIGILVFFGAAGVAAIATAVERVAGEHRCEKSR